MVTVAQMKFVRSLSNKRERVESGLFVAEGSKLIGDILNTSLKIEKVYALESVDVDFGTTTVESVTRKELERMTNLKTAPDAIALIRIPEYSDLNFDGLTIALDGVQDPGNMGTIIRIADWFGIRKLICSAGCADCYGPKVIQATMGSIARVEIHYSEDLASMLADAAKQGVPIFGTFLEGDNIYKKELPQNGIIVMGSEGTGISKEVAKTITDKLYVPPFDVEGAHCESLNVAVATAIVCSEFRRR